MKKLIQRIERFLPYYIDEIADRKKVYNEDQAKGFRESEAGDKWVEKTTEMEEIVDKSYSLIKALGEIFEECPKDYFGDETTSEK